MLTKPLIMVREIKGGKRRNKWWRHPYTNFQVKGIETQGKQG
jgi:hypothetical protein